MQFIRVTFPDRRTVFIDGGATGRTGVTLTIDEGPHDVDLGTPQNYTPSQQSVNPFGTSLENPEAVPFARSVGLSPPTVAPASLTNDAVAGGAATRARRRHPSRSRGQHKQAMRRRPKKPKRKATKRRAPKGRKSGRRPAAVRRTKRSRSKKG
jgi:hypothetical protein